MALALTCPSLTQPTIPGCPIHRALCDGWDHKNSTSLHAFAFSRLCCHPTRLCLCPLTLKSQQNRLSSPANVQIRRQKSQTRTNQSAYTPKNKSAQLGILVSPNPLK